MNADPEYGVSWLHLHRTGIGIEFADQTVSIFLGECREVRDEGFNQVTARLFEGLSTAEVRGVGLNEVGIEVVLPDQQAEPVAETRLRYCPCRSGSHADCSFDGDSGRRCWRPKNRIPRPAKPDPVGFAQSTIDGTGFGDPHLGAAARGRRVRGIGVAIANEAIRPARCANSSLEDPTVCIWSQSSRTAVTWMAEHRLRRAKRSETTWVTYHFPSRYRRSPSAIENPKLAVKSRNVYSAVGSGGPGIERFANLIFCRTKASTLRPEVSRRVTFLAEERVGLAEMRDLIFTGFSLLFRDSNSKACCLSSR